MDLIVILHFFVAVFHHFFAKKNLASFIYDEL